MRWLCVLILGLVAMTASTRSADACPCCEPCSKYDQTYKQIDPPLFEVYVRAQVAPLPRRVGRAHAMKLLTRSRWISRRPIADQPQRLRLLDGSNLPDTVPNRAGERLEIVRQIELKRGRFELVLDGNYYVLSPCRANGRLTTCLVRVSR
jgi:hypothetical protein